MDRVMGRNEIKMPLLSILEVVLLMETLGVGSETFKIVALSLCPSSVLQRLHLLRAVHPLPCAAAGEPRALGVKKDCDLR